MNKTELERRVEELEVENARLRAEGRQVFEALQTRENLVVSLSDLDLYRRGDISTLKGQMRDLGQDLGPASAAKTTDDESEDDGAERG